MSEYHNPVLLNESIEALVQDPCGVYADATFGGGGHSREILKRLDAATEDMPSAKGTATGSNPHIEKVSTDGGKTREKRPGRLVSFDRDNDAISRAATDPDFAVDNFTLVHNNFRFIHNYAMMLSRQQWADDIDHGDRKGRQEADDMDHGDKKGKQAADDKDPQGRKSRQAADDKSPQGRKPAEGYFDGILADLGVSSHQFDTAERGFSFRYDAPLDMRMNTQAESTAADIVNSYSQEDLERILRIYGEVDNARRAAALIVSARDRSPINTTADLDNALKPCLPPYAEHKYLAKVYQALRIEVNQEMRSLEKFLEGATKSLKKGGRLVVITYHSLEDRMVKNFIKSGNIDGEMQQDQIYGGSTAPLKAVNRKPILPSEEEIASNTRARSAKLRIAEKL